MDIPDQEAKSAQYTVPENEISEIIGLIELLKMKGGRDDIYKLAAELQMELGETLAVIRGAEMLGLVNTPGGDVLIESLGEKVCDASKDEKQKIICAQMEKIPLFQKVRDFVKAQDDLKISKDDMMEKLAELIPNENAEKSFSNILNWGRYAELFGYNDDTQTFYLDDEDFDT